MIKQCLFAVALLSLALAGGCAKGGNGTGSGITVTVGDSNIPAIYPNQHVTFTATVSGTTNQTVTWSLSGTGSECTGAGNPCGTIDKNTGVYVAPTAPPSPATVTITATSAADNTATGLLQVHIVLIAVTVTPTTVTVGQNLVQQFTAIATPDDAPQTFTWTCTPNGSCGSLVQDPNVSGLAVYTAPATNGPVVVAATSTVQQSPPAVGQAKVQVATSRLAAGTYAFRFSGYDTSNNPVAAAGSFILAANGTITAGVEDVLSASGPHQYPITQVLYSPISKNNNLGTLTLALNGGATNTYTAVLTSSGIFRMIEADNAGTGSGVLQKSAANTVFDAGAQTFVFGFTGVDKATAGNRVGYVGVLPLDGSGKITGGLLDPNDNGNNVCGAQPCNVTGTYSQPNANLPTWWQLTLSSVTTQKFDFFVSGGQTQTKTGPNPLTLYAISTDPIDGAHPALSGSMVYQVPMTYNNAAFSGTSVSNLTGTNANVSLTLGTTDGASGGTGGTGGFTGTFDQNDHGAIVSVPPVSSCAPPTVCAFSYTYVATSGTNGRYTFQMLGNPNAPVVAPLPFVLYASGANRGFLLDQSSPAVMTGTMDPQPSKASYTPTELPGTYASATISNSDPSIAPVVQNLLLTSTGGATYNVGGTQNPGNQMLSGKYTMTSTGVGTITLTAPPPPTAATNVIYAIDFDAVNSVVTDFMMMGTTSGTPSAIIFAQQ
jgi:hypothetical protein